MTRAIETIKSDISRLVEVRLMSAVESGEWNSALILCDSLRELIERGAWHAVQEKVSKINSFAMGSHSERDPR